MKRIFITLCLLAFVSISRAESNENTHQQTFKQYLTNIKKRATAAKISNKTIHHYLDYIHPPKAIKKSIYIRRQTHEAAKIYTFDVYKNQFIPKSTYSHGRRQYQHYYKLLKKVEAAYHVQPQYIVALWGIESNYGRYKGNFPLIRSLAILGYHHHRSDFYQHELINALIILDRPKTIPQQLKSSWDGGMGQSQFEPSAYLYSAVDFDNDGFANIWTSLPDVFASIANFLHQRGWNGQQGWGMAVTLPRDFPIKQSGRKIEHPIQYWRKLGVTQLDGKPLESIKGNTSILLPDGISHTAYVVYPNFRVLLQWNNITFEGLCTGILSDIIASKVTLP